MINSAVTTGIVTHVAVVRIGRNASANDSYVSRVGVIHPRIRIIGIAESTRSRKQAKDDHQERYSPMLVVACGEVLSLFRLRRAKFIGAHYSVSPLDRGPKLIALW